MKKINWLDHIVNLVVVILGISIAFYLEGYREEKHSKKLEEKYLESLIADLNQDLSTIDTLLKYNKGISEALVDLSNASVNFNKILNDTVLLNKILLIQYNPAFSPQRTTYESLKASGKMDLIQDFDVRNQIIGLYEQDYMGANEYDILIDQHLRDFIKPLYMNQVRFNSNLSVNDEFLYKDEFKNMIFVYRYLFLDKDTLYGTVLDQARDLKKSLEEYKDQLKTD